MVVLVYSMGRALKENLVIAALAGVSIPLALGIYFLADWLLHDWMKWIEFGLFTAVIFGGLGYRVRGDLKQGRCLVVFLALFALHCGAFVCLFRGGVEIRTAWYVPIVFLESLAFGLILTGPGGAPTDSR